MSLFSVGKKAMVEETEVCSSSKYLTDARWGIISSPYSGAAPDTGPAGLGTEEKVGLGVESEIID